MPVTVVVGGQFGSEGKGKVAHEFARRDRASVAVRVGGSNSGHTVIDERGRPQIFRHLPTAAILPDTICVIAAGSYIDADVLAEEIDRTGLCRDRLLIDPHAVLITQRNKAFEANSQLREHIGSTGSGTGGAVINRIKRNGSARFAASDNRLAAFVQPIREFLRERLNRNERILIEGTQGFGLSLLHADDYPNVTSRDTTASAFVSESGLSPLDVDEVVLVIRSFPIRVSGNSGPLPNEISWDVVTAQSGNAAPISERTTVTGNVRRVGYFDANIVNAAMEANAPTSVVLNHVDYFDARCSGSFSLTGQAAEEVSRIEESIGRHIDFLGFGRGSLVPRVSDVHNLRAG